MAAVAEVWRWSLGTELRGKLANPLRFQWGSGGTEIPPTTVHGFDATLLIDVCKAVIAAEAEGKLTQRQAKIAKQAHIILGASAKAGIKGLVYALAGYDAPREETIAAFKFYVCEEAREYEKEFPNQLYAEWYRLYSLPQPERNKPWKFMHLTVDQVYRPLAKSNGKILELTKEQRTSSNKRWKKLHQFLSEIGVKALRTHLGQLLGIARIAKTRVVSELCVGKIIPKMAAVAEVWRWIRSRFPSTLDCRRMSPHTQCEPALYTQSRGTSK